MTQSHHLCKKENSKHKFCHEKDTLRGSVRMIIENGELKHKVISNLTARKQLNNIKPFIFFENFRELVSQSQKT